MFEIIPAIDILNGKCVRLSQGIYGSETIYSKDPLEMAKKWEGLGATRLHVIDLEGARTGTPESLDIIKQIIREMKIPVQVGGGIRNFGLIEEMLKVGADRIVLGTTAIKNPNLISRACEKYDDKVIIGIDAKDQHIVIEGWTKSSKKEYRSMAKEAVELGAKRFVYTDIKRDGMLTGPDLEGVRRLISAVQVPVIYSGGISSKEDIENLKQIQGLEGCIVGKALYTGAVKLEEII